MAEDDLPLLPGFREMALSARRERMLAELVAERKAAGLSQSEVADRMGTSQPAVARVEAGVVDVRLSTLQRYAAAVGRRLELRLADQRSVRPSPRAIHESSGAADQLPGTADKSSGAADQSSGTADKE